VEVSRQERTSLKSGLPDLQNEKEKPLFVKSAPDIVLTAPQGPDGILPLLQEAT
jgi:hypothetical protein